MAYQPILFDLNLAPPGQMKMPRIIGGSRTGGVAASGISTYASISGDGFVAIDYSDILINNANPESLRYWSRLSSVLSGGIRPITVPFLIDFIQPFVASDPLILSPHSDGSPHSDSSEFSTDRASGVVVSPALAGDATITLSVIGGTGLIQGGEWFSIGHVTRGDRAYTIVDIDSETTDGDGNNVYTVGIRPTLRENINALEYVQWDRPRCLMCAPDPIETEVTPYWHARPSVRFVEWF